MNILPFLSSFLLIFALITSSFVKDLTVTKKEEQNYCAYMKASQEIMAKEQEDHYKHSRRKSSNQKKATDQKSGIISNNSPSSNTKATPTSQIVQSKPRRKRNPSKPYVWRREKNRYLAIENSKFNLHALIEMSKNQKDIKETKEYEAAANLLKIMYENSPFYKKITDENPQNYILDKLIEAGKNNASYKVLFDLFPRNKKDHSTFYKIFQGTKRYSIAKRLGYPPLYHYFTVDKEHLKTIYLAFSSKIVLEAYFGKEVCEEIRKVEEENWRTDKEKPITEDGLKKILSDQYRGIVPDGLLDHIHFSKDKQLSRFTRLEHAQDDKKAFILELPKVEESEKVDKKKKASTTSEKAKES